MVRSVGQERQVAGALDSVGKRALVLGAGAGTAARLDSGTIGDEAAKERDVLVVHVPDVIGAHDADAPSAAASATPWPVVIIAIAPSATGGWARTWPVSARRGG